MKECIIRKRTEASVVRTFIHRLAFSHQDLFTESV